MMVFSTPVTIDCSTPHGVENATPFTISSNILGTVEQVKFACAIISRIRKLVSHSRT